VAERALGIKWGMMEMGAPGVRMGWHPDGLSVLLPLFLPCTTQSPRWQAMMDEVDKGCNDFYITVGTVTRTAGILIHSHRHWLLNLSHPSGRLQLYAGLTESNNPRCAMDLVVCANPISSSLWV